MGACACIDPDLLATYGRILEMIEDAPSDAISGHTSPDGDALYGFKTMNPSRGLL